MSDQNKNETKSKKLSRFELMASKPEVATDKVVAPKKAVRTKAPTKEKGDAEPSRGARDGTVMIGGHFSPEWRRQMKEICHENETSMQKLLEEAIRDLLTKYEKHT